MMRSPCTITLPTKGFGEAVEAPFDARSRQRRMNVSCGTAAKLNLYRTFGCITALASNPSYDELLQRLSTRFTASEARYALRCLVEDALPEKKITTEADIQLLNALVERLISGEPLQYVTGVAWFFKLRFAVNQSVLIPRPETEELVEWVLDTFPNGTFSVLDIGTGSGCIAIALKRMRPDWSVAAWDVSNDALSTARNNATRNAADVSFELRDLTQITNLPQTLDVIVSNPPYIARDEASELDENVLAHEPHVALFAPPNEPLFFYKAICEVSTKALVENGAVFVELNQRLAEETFKLFMGYFRYVEMRRDISGNFRMLMASGPKER